MPAKLSKILDKLQAKYPDDEDLMMAQDLLADEDYMEGEEDMDMEDMDMGAESIDLGMEEDEEGMDELGLPLPGGEDDLEGLLDMEDEEEMPMKKKKKMKEGM